MSKLIDDHYSGSNAKNYNSGRSKNGKWIFEQKVLADFLKNHPEIETVIDAPLGTNRFANLLERTKNVTKVYGYEFSDAMINEAKKEISTKLDILKWDLVSDEIVIHADLSLVYRMLNLFEEKTSLRILGNVLSATDDYSIFTLRCWDKDPILVQNKIHVQNKKVFEDYVIDAGFDIVDVKTRDDKVEGKYSVYTIKRK
jgi:hypothetical protein